VFAWVFCTTLFLLTCVAAWIDTRTAKIPNRLTVLILILGLLANAVRGGWMAAQGREAAMGLWTLPPESGWWLGVLHGLGYAFTGFLLAFVVMFLAWMFGMCGGGDVKLVASVSAWVGIDGFPLVWIVSGLVLIGWMAARAFSGGLSPKQMQRKMARYRQAHAEKAAARVEGRPEASPKRGKMRVTYSVPIAVATAVVLLVYHKVELGLVQPKPQPDQQQNGAAAHARRLPPLA
jgi:Flp pilus assembly protein protease CpaA